LLKQAEHQADDRLDLLIGVEGNLAGGLADIPGRQRERQFSAAGLGQPTEAIRCLIRCSSTSVIVPFNPSRSRSLCQFGS
jgi:hypothetical protein